jgi:hypothetical protein
MSFSSLAAFLRHRPALDALFVALPLEDPVHEDARRVDVDRVDRADLDELFDLGDRDLGRPWPSSG